MACAHSGPRLGVFCTSGEDPFVVKTPHGRESTTPGLSSPGPFSSPSMAFSSDFERCDTPESATSPEMSTRGPRIRNGSAGLHDEDDWMSPLQSKTHSHSHAHFGALDLELDPHSGMTSMDTRSDFADDESDGGEPRSGPAATSARRQHWDVSAVPDADLDLAQLLLHLRDGTRKRAQTVSGTFGTSSNTAVPRHHDHLLTSASSSPARDTLDLGLLTPITPPATLDDAESVLSDLTPLRASSSPTRPVSEPTPTRRASTSRATKKYKPGPKERARLKAEAAKAAASADDNEENEEPTDDATPQPTTMRSRKRSAASTPAPRPVKRRATAARAKQPEVQTVEIDGVWQETIAELEGFLVETLALSRTTSMTAVQLVNAVLGEQSHLRDERSEETWLSIFEKILVGLPVFGSIHRDQKDADGRKLDDQFYYQIEQDRADRAAIWQDVVRSKRATTKRDDVQYYWKPVRALVKRW